MRFERALLVVTLVIAFACTPTANWNHGTTGPSRYAVWLVPFVAFVLVRVAEAASAHAGRLALAALVLACGMQSALVAAAGGPFARPDYLHHSTAARLLLRQAPGLYRPDPATFAERTLHQTTTPPGLVVYEEDGRCRKALAWPSDRDTLRARCGELPGGAEPLVATTRRNRVFVDY